MTDASVLRDLLPPDRMSTATADRDHHGRDWGTPPEKASPPDVVVWPETTAEVSDVLAAATEGLDGRRCPDCGTRVVGGATRCRWCHRALDGTGTTEGRPEAESDSVPATPRR